MSERFVRIAVLWFTASVGLGVYMGLTHNFMDKPVHVHGNLLGWVSCSLFALLHRAWPRLSESPLARAHFWLHNLGLPTLVAGLLCMTRGAAAAGPLLGIGSLSLFAGVVLFATAVWQVTARPAGRAAPSTALGAEA